jgi:hypothetical protein
MNAGFLRSCHYKNSPSAKLSNALISGRIILVDWRWHGKASKTLTKEEFRQALDNIPTSKHSARDKAMLLRMN